MTEGNPLFTMEVVRFLARSGRPPRETLDRGEVPRGITESVRGRLAALPEATRRLVVTAAVIGREFDVAVLRRVTGLALEGMMQALAGATAALLVGPVPAALGVYRFTHGLFRDVAYDVSSVADRAELHRRVGEALESFTVPGSEPAAAQLAHHFLRAALGAGSEKAVSYSVAASRQALRALAFDDAAAHAERALTAIGSDPSLEPLRFDALLALGEALTLAGDYARARSSYAEAFSLAKRAGDPEKAASAALGYARVKPESGTTHVDVVEILREAARLLDGAAAAGHRPLLDRRALVLSRIAACLAVTGQAEEAVARSAEALEIARGLGNPTTLARALLSRHWALWRPGTAGDRLHIAGEILALERTLGQGELVLDARLGQITDLLELGRPEAFGTALDEYRKLAEATRDPLALWNARVFETTHAVLAGRLDAAEHLAEETLPIGSRIQEETAQMFYAAQMWAIRLEQDRAREVEPLSRALLATQPENVSFRGALLRVLAETGDVEGAREELARLLPEGSPDLPLDWLYTPTLCHASVATWVAGDSRRAERIERALVPFDGTHAVVGPAILYLGPVSFYLGLCAMAQGNTGAAAERLERAVAESDHLGAAPTAARARCLLGTVLVRRGAPGDVARTAKLLEASQRASEALGLVANVARCAALRDALAAATSGR
jgi:tetratricopeptide (TPR) repeat protein